MANLLKETFGPLLAHWLQTRLDAETTGWIEKTAADVPLMNSAQVERAVALVGRKAGKADLALTGAELGEAQRLRPGWVPRFWTIADVARTSTLLPLADDAVSFGTTFRRLCQAADLATLIGFYRALPLFPISDDLDWQIGEGLRTSIREIFEAIAHDSPVPAETFSEHRWNHMVLKALFIDSSLPPIVGLDKRRNDDLAATLVDYVHERRAARRGVDLHVWRCIAPFARGEVLGEINPLLVSPDPIERSVAALFLAESPDPASRSMLAGLATEHAAIASRALSWSSIPA
ncbi:EboA domain-containing protein [Pelagibacterium sp. 26DY04]|uniref:EboA domain-containing protein n=1 Tax=Pelagibacterium sp. 26DY04 TaxID=2967130 RepID=UPI002814A6F1|nr:EboA domain-containing protein [Pelagibacterium sp. 26DY04]WMT85500.1 EboA domain-containing protein [Pelagibacterium sp. 26DY04]